MKKVAIKVVKEVKVDNRVNNTGRPVNKKSARQIRLNKQAATKQAMDYVMQGGWFKLTENCTGAYVYVPTSCTDASVNHCFSFFGLRCCSRAEFLFSGFHRLKMRYGCMYNRYRCICNPLFVIFRTSILFLGLRFVLGDFTDWKCVTDACITVTYASVNHFFFFFGFRFLFSG